jgi:hypothetical protein
MLAFQEPPGSPRTASRKVAASWPERACSPSTQSNVPSVPLPAAPGWALPHRRVAGSGPWNSDSCPAQSRVIVYGCGEASSLLVASSYRWLLPRFQIAISDGKRRAPPFAIHDLVDGRGTTHWVDVSAPCWFERCPGGEPGGAPEVVVANNRTRRTHVAQRGVPPWGRFGCGIRLRDGIPVDAKCNSRCEGQNQDRSCQGRHAGGLCDRTCGCVDLGLLRGFRRWWWRRRLVIGEWEPAVRANRGPR